MAKQLFFAIAFLAMTFCAGAQISHGGAPLHNHDSFKVLSHGVTLSPVDDNALLNEDLQVTRFSTPMRVGVLQDCQIDLIDRATVYKKDGMDSYIISLTSPEAKAVSVHFSDFQMAEGSEMYFFDATGDFVLGSFLPSDVKNDGTFYTQAIPGNTVFIEYDVPSNANPGKLVVDALCHYYKDRHLSSSSAEVESAKGPHGYAEGTCHPNTICPEGDDWRDEIRSVVAIEIWIGSNAYMCSGTLVNNARQDKKPYVLSAYHCQETDNGGSPSSLIFYFNYETYYCDRNIGIANHSVTGATTLAKASMNNGSDFWLVELTDSIPVRYKPYYAGWNRQTTAPQPGMLIHHPGGDYKKLSIPQNITAGTGSYSVFWIVKYLQENNKGVSEQGSSGSGIFDANHRVVGTLTGGESYCEYVAGLDYFGRMNAHWSRGNTSSTSVRFWLDPDNTGITTLDGLDYTETSAGIDDNGQVIAKHFVTYPNPTSGTVRFDIPAIGDANYKLFDLIGRCVLEGRTVLTSTTQGINLSGTAAGAYRLMLYTSSGIYQTSVIVK